MLLERVLKLHGVNVALERHLELSVLSLVDGAVERDGLTSLDMSFCSVEVRVAGHDVAFVYEIREQHVLCGTSLMCRYYILKASEPLYRLFQLEE